MKGLCSGWKARATVEGCGVGVLGKECPGLFFGSLQETDRMSRYCLKTAVAVLLGICGCHPGMYGPYGQGMYGPPSGTLVVPPATNAPPYPVDAPKGTFDEKDSSDDFQRDPRFYNSDPATGDEKVPNPKDAGAAGSGAGMFPAEGQ